MRVEDQVIIASQLVSLLNSFRPELSDSPSGKRYYVPLLPDRAQALGIAGETPHGHA